MSDDNKTKYQLDLDTQQFVEGVLAAKDHISSLGDAKNLEGLIGGLTKVGLGLGALGVAAFTVKESMDLVFDGEKIEAVNRQFELLTKNAGLSGDSLRAALESAAKGTINETDLLRIANEAIVNMGISAGKLGPLLEVARKSAAITGEDSKTAFEGITKAIEFGNERMLKHAGIVLNVEQVYQKYADTIGVAVGALSQAEKQQALMNGVLDYSDKKLKEINPDLSQATTSWQRMKVAFVDLGEAIAVIWAGTLGPIFSRFFEVTAGIAKSLKDVAIVAFGNDAEKAGLQTKSLEAQLVGLNKQAAMLKEIIAKDSRPTAVEHARVELERVNKEIDEATKRIDTFKSKTKAIEGPGGSPAPEQDNKKRLESESAYQKDRLALKKSYENQAMALDKEELASDVKLAQTSEQVKANLDRQDVLTKQQSAQKIKAIEEETALKSQQIDTNNMLSVSQKERLRVQLKHQSNEIIAQEHKNLNLRLERDDIDVQKAEIKANETRLAHAKKVDQQMAASAQLRAKQAALAWQQSGGLGGLAINQFQDSYMTAMENIGKGSKSASEIMQGFFFGAIGGMASAAGRFMVLDAFKTFPAVSVPELAAGSALIALGSFLSSMGQGSSADVGPSGTGIGDSGGGLTMAAATAVATPAADVSSGTAAASTQPATPKQSVTIQIQGHYFDTDDTRKRLTEIIREHQDATDFRFLQIGQF